MGYKYVILKTADIDKLDFPMFHQNKDTVRYSLDGKMFILSYQNEAPKILEFLEKISVGGQTIFTGKDLLNMPKEVVQFWEEDREI